MESLVTRRWNVFPVGTIKTPVKVFATNPYDALMKAAATLCMTPREFRCVEEDVYFNVHGGPDDGPLEENQS